jgi:mRNA interferase MazF
MRKLKQFDIIFVDFGKVYGSEQTGSRPCVVVQNNLGNKYCPTVLVCPLTSSIKHIDQPTHCIIYANELNGLRYDSMILGEQMVSVSKDRIIKWIGCISDAETQSEIISVCLNNFVGYKNSSHGERIVKMIIGFLGGRNYVGCGENAENYKREGA